MKKIQSSGFSLVEMAVVLVIASLILGAVISMGNAQITQSRISTTKQKEDTIKTALISYIARNYRLPCPAVPTLEPDDVGYGVEEAGPDCIAVPSFGAGINMVSIGVIPWISLGLSEEAAQDSYNNRFTYAVATNATKLDITTLSGLKGNLTIHTAAPPTALTQSNNCAIGTSLYNPCASVVVVLSHGASAAGAYNKSGNRIATAAGADETENFNDDNTFVDKDFSESGVNGYDDIVLPLTSSELLSPLTMHGALKDYNAELRQDIDVILSAAVIYGAANRSPDAFPNRTYPLPPDMAAMNLQVTATIDPWGNAIEYAPVPASSPIGMTSDASLVAFRLISPGPDNTLTTTDDIPTIVWVGDLKAKFSTYGW